MIKLFEKLKKQDKELILKSEAALKNGYDPYSSFYVGSALLTSKGNVYCGANLATPTYMGLCAERVAIGTAATNGEYHFKTIALIAKSDHYEVKTHSGPCGLCRQLIWEFSELFDEDIKILVSDSMKYKVLITTIRDIHPYGFGPRLCDGKIEKYLRPNNK